MNPLWHVILSVLLLLLFALSIISLLPPLSSHTPTSAFSSSPPPCVSPPMTHVFWLPLLLSLSLPTPLGTNLDNLDHMEVGRGTDRAHMSVHTVQLPHAPNTQPYSGLLGLCVMFDLCFTPCCREFVCVHACVQKRESVPRIPMTMAHNRGA